MIRIEQLTDDESPAQARLMLPFELRQKSRLLCRTVEGEEAGLFLPRGTVVRGGRRLLAHDGRIVEMVAAPERVLIVRADTPQALARAAYHLGNRHVPVEVAADHLKLEYDHVLADMLRGLGVRVEEANVPFEPESGAYGQGAVHGHEHDR